MPSACGTRPRAGIVTAALGLSVIVAGCLAPGPSELCCNTEYPDRSSNERDYCGDIAMVALDYIFAPDDIIARRTRRAEIALLLDRLEFCRSMHCFLVTIDTVAAADAFDHMLLRTILESDARRSIPDMGRTAALICGLRHAVQVGVD